VSVGDVTISELWIHPIKSCRGVSVTEATVVDRGFDGDRRYMIVDDAGLFITQREERRLALVDVSFSASELTLNAPGLSPLSVPRAPERGERVPVKVWRSECEALVEPEGSRWLSEHLGRSCRLVYMPDDVERAVSPARARPGDIVGFQDGYPFLMISEASLTDISSRRGAPVEARRFRPNIGIRGCAALEEDEMAELEIGPVRLSNVKLCERCVVVGIDPDTADSSKEPLATLATYRKTESGVMFGANLIHTGRGLVRTGDAVVRIGDHAVR
jgi:uncharacterized protein YcbX